MPSASRNKGATSPKERIIPIEIESSKSKNKTKPVVVRYDPSDTSDAESVIVRDVAEETSASKNKKSQNQYEVKVVESKPKKLKEDLKNSKKDSKQKDSKENATTKANLDVNKNHKEVDKKKNEKAKVKNAEKGVDDSKGRKNKSTKHELSNVTITTQPGKSILKHPIATSTPIPVVAAVVADHPESSWANQSTTSTGTVVKKPASMGSRCCAWLCMPFGLCCACDPLECECCNFCILRCSRCFQQCYCSCCNRKCC